MATPSRTNDTKARACLALFVGVLLFAMWGDRTLSVSCPGGVPCVTLRS